MKKIVLLSVLCVCILAGCKKKGTPDQDREVVVFFSTKSISSSVLKTTGSAAENQISGIKVFGVTGSGDVEYTHEPDVPDPLSTAIQLVIPRTVVSLYAVANPSDALKAENPSTLSDLMAMTGDFSDAPGGSPFLMSGSGAINNNGVNIEFTRVAAKVEITGKNDFQIATVTVENTPGEGYVFRRDPFSIPGSTGMESYDPVTSPAPVLYVAENTTVSPTRFVVTGMFDGKTARYNIVLKNEGQNIDILRNTWYKVGITPVTEDECDVSFSVADWEDEDTEDHVIPDSAFE